MDEDTVEWDVYESLVNELRYEKEALLESRREEKSFLRACARMERKRDEAMQDRDSLELELDGVDQVESALDEYESACEITRVAEECRLERLRSLGLDGDS